MTTSGFHVSDSQPVSIQCSLLNQRQGPHTNVCNHGGTIDLKGWVRLHLEGPSAALELRSFGGLTITDRVVVAATQLASC